MKFLKRTFVYFFKCKSCGRPDCRTKNYEAAKLELCRNCRSPKYVPENQANLFVN